MRKILVIGIGAGNPDYLTIQAIDALNRADVFFIPDKGAEKAALRELRTAICERFIKRATYRTVGFTMPKRAEAAASIARNNARIVDTAQMERDAAAREAAAILKNKP